MKTKTEHSPFEREVERKINVVDIVELGDENLQTKWLIEGWLEEESLACLYGERHIHKSYVALTWCHLLAQASHIDNRNARVDISRSIRSLYIATEGSKTIRPRYEALKTKYGESPEKTFFVYQDEWNWTDEHINLFCEEYVAGSFQLIVIDSLSQSLDDQSVNSDAAMRSILNQVKKLRDKLKTTVLLIAHSGKNPTKGIMGSSVLGNDIDTEIRVSGKKKHSVTLTKQRNGSKEDKQLSFEPFPIHLGKDNKGKPITNLYIEFGDHILDDFDKQILAALKKCTAGGFETEVKKAEIKDTLQEILYPSGIVSKKNKDALRTKFNNRTNSMVRSGLLEKTVKDRIIYFSERTNEKVGN